MIRLVVAVAGGACAERSRSIAGLAGDVADLVEQVAAHTQRIAVLLGGNGREPAVVVVAEVGGHVVGQGLLGLPNPLVLQADGLAVEGDAGRLVVLVVAVSVLFPFRAGVGCLVAGRIIGIAVTLREAAHGDGFGEFPVQLVIGDRTADARLGVAGHVAGGVVAEGILGGVGVGYFGQPVGCVIDVTGNLLFGVRDGLEQAVWPVAVFGNLTHGPGFPDLTAGQVVVKGGDVAHGVIQGDQVAQAVVAEAGAPFVDGAGQLFPGDQVAVAVVDQFRLVVQRVDGFYPTALLPLGGLLVGYGVVKDRKNISLLICQDVSA